MLGSVPSVMIWIAAVSPRPIRSVEIARQNDHAVDSRGGEVVKEGAAIVRDAHPEIGRVRERRSKITVSGVGSSITTPTRIFVTSNEMPKPKRNRSSAGRTKVDNQTARDRARTASISLHDQRADAPQPPLWAFMRWPLVGESLSFNQRDECVFQRWIRNSPCARGPESVGRTDRDALAAIDQRHAVAIFRLVHEVRGDHHGDAARPWR